MRRVLQRRHGRMEPGFNLTPMLDMIFYLLFFFIMASKVRDDADYGMNVRLPEARSAQEMPATPAPSLALAADGRIFYQERLVTRDQLEMELRGLVSRGQYSIVIRGDERVALGRAIELMDWCRLMGMKDAIIESRPPRDEGTDQARP